MGRAGAPRRASSGARSVCSDRLCFCPFSREKIGAISFAHCCWSITSGNFLVSHPKCLLFEMGLSISSVGLLRDFLGRRDQQYESSRAAPCVTWLRAELETTNAMPGS